MALLAALPFLEYLIIFTALRSRKIDARSAALYAACYWGVVLLALTELASLGRHLDRYSLAAAWLLAIIVTTAVSRPRAPATVRASARLFRPWRMLRRLRNGDRALLLAVMLLVVAVGITAIVSPPNTWDVIDYHMSRVAMWISNRSLGFFPTFDYTQLVYAPWAEYAMLNLTILYGADRLVNVVELGSLVGVIIGASALARELGAGARGQVLAAVLCATLPTAVLEGSGSMNGVAVSFWITASVFGLLRFAADESWYALIAGAAAAGLAIATKGTAYVILPGVLAACAWMAYASARRPLVQVPAFLLIVAALNLPLWYRTGELTGNPLGTGFAEGGPHLQAMVGRVTLRGTAANVVRNAALQITLSESIDSAVARAAARAINWFGADANDRDYLWRTLEEVNGYSRFVTNPPTRSEAFAGNPLQALLLGLALPLCLVLPLPRRRKVGLYAVGVIASFLLFCALLRWQRWNARLMLPILVLAAPPGAVVFEAWLKPRITTVAAWALLLAAIPFALANELRPLLLASLSKSALLSRPFAGNVWTKSRGGLYFKDHHGDLFDSYLAASRFVQTSECREVGMDNTFEHYEYPVMAFLDVPAGRVRVRYTGVHNSTARYTPVAQKPPCAVICFACAGSRMKQAEYAGVGGRMSVFDDLVVFSRDGVLANDGGVTRAGDGIERGAPDVEISRAFKALEQFRAQQLPSYNKLYLAAEQRNPALSEQLTARFEALDRPYYDATRIRELTRQLTDSGPGSGADASVMLAESAEAMDGLVLAETRRAESFARFTSQR